jgi:hypothetical protein
MHKLCLLALVPFLALVNTKDVAADSIKFGPITTWGHRTAPGTEDTLRGLAFDGHYYYVDDCNDYLIDGRPRDNTGRIYIYDRNGRLYKRIPETPPAAGRGSFFPHGVATDGVKLWTTGYFDKHIYEYDIATGALLRTLESPVTQPIALDYQANTKTLWLTAYGDPRVYKVNLSGTIISSFTTSMPGPWITPSLDGRGGLWLSSSSVSGGPKALKRYTTGGTFIKDYSAFEPGYTSMAADGTGLDTVVKDLAPKLNSVTGRWEARFQQFWLKALRGGTKSASSISVTCKNRTTNQTVLARIGTDTSSWNCEDGGLLVAPGDPVHIEIDGIKN